jgi:outer membrane PBP1 activator LpoA protein
MRLISRHAALRGFARYLLPLLAASLLAACGTVTTRPTQTGNNVAVSAAFADAETLAQRDATLTGQAQLDNRAQIEHALAGLDNATLAREAAALPAGDPLYNFAGRALLKRGLALPRPFDLDHQRFAAGNRPPADSDGYRPPVKLAVLLPLSGDLSRAAVPVRDGLLAGYYGEQRRRPEIRFYDTIGTAAGAITAYGNAVADGADYVVGPLGRDEVSALFGTRLTVPVLALNRGSVPPPSGSASFSLAPEDDGVAAAEYLLSRNLRHVLVLGNANLRRATTAFRDQLQSRGGTVVDTLAVADANPVLDMTAALKASAQKPGGIDAVFLALDPDQVRALLPQLDAAGLAASPRVMTSSVEFAAGATGLDGVIFPSETWGARGVPGLPSPAAAAKLLPSTRGGGAKLFAFGHDAWLLTAYMERLATRADGSIHGATGTLRLDGFGNVLRVPAWATFRGGTIVPMAAGAP